MKALLNLFPDSQTEIERLRSCDLIFAEICRDYEMLAGLLPCAADDPAFPDIRNSLTGLQDEIRAYLERTSPDSIVTRRSSEKPTS